eukprot:CAMPEP_0117647790 /NCGR_PEP_ID=MMETSP0804-20121206/35_1 /TAXON_ID=1074897 /ORGANISM="Tetraselmis astigmatica, Strain CCMP880" /LENGTH=543 /DNA_ID=CAMNT_0005453301 /DNA_START=151 /DNA_END=1782 /DNA_ORIENTATION=+
MRFQGLLGCTAWCEHHHPVLLPSKLEAARAEEIPAAGIAEESIASRHVSDDENLGEREGLEVCKLRTLHSMFRAQQMSMASTKRRGQLPRPGGDALDGLLSLPPNTGLKKRRQTYEKVSEKLEHDSAIGIIKLEVTHCDPVRKLGVLQYVRGAVAILAYELTGIRLVKADDERIFAASGDPLPMIKFAISVRHLCEAFGEKYPSLAFTCSVGVDSGQVLLVPGDYYGDPVNIASKLGEDNAQPGDVSISQTCMEKTMEAEGGAAFFENLSVDHRRVEISGVYIDYVLLGVPEGRQITVIIPQAVLPEDDTVHSWVRSKAGMDVEKQQALMCMESLQLKWEPRFSLSHAEVTNRLLRRCAMVQSDMSGFTRLTRAYGIMHFLTLVMQCRLIYAEVLSELGGSVLKYDGDNVICIFDTAAQAAVAVSAVTKKVAEYNRGLEKDFQIRLKFGMAVGDVFLVGHDIVGHSWDVCCLLGEEMAQVGEILVTSPAHDEILADNSLLVDIRESQFQLRQVDGGVPMVAYNMIPLEVPDNSLVRRSMGSIS